MLRQKLINQTNKILYWPICRAYSKFVIKDKPADLIYQLLCSIQFYQIHRFWPNLNKPRKFTEKLWYRMMFDRNPLLTIVNDKIEVRNYVASKGKGNYLIPLLWHGINPIEIQFEELPENFVIKTNPVSSPGLRFFTH